jgi:hypothetical protein
MTTDDEAESGGSAWTSHRDAMIHVLSLAWDVLIASILDWGVGCSQS